jgi:hypothetical protein
MRRLWPTGGFRAKNKQTKIDRERQDVGVIGGIKQESLWLGNGAKRWREKRKLIEEKFTVSALW